MKGSENKISNRGASDSADTSGNAETNTSSKESDQIKIPDITLPKGGGAIKSIDEKFSVNAANGTAGFSIPFPFSASRNAFMPSIYSGLLFIVAILTRLCRTNNSLCYF